MKTIGFLGGMSWESTLVYYRFINEEVRKILGDSHSAQMIIHSFDFYKIKELQDKHDWTRITAIMAEAALSLEKAGAGLLMIGSNTMHIVAEELERYINIPLLYSADALAEDITRRGVRSVVLLGTLFTMEEAFFRERIEKKCPARVIIPGKKDRERINSIIFKELTRGVIKPGSRAYLLSVIEKLAGRPAEMRGIIMGCTELPLLLRPSDTFPVPVFNTLEIHARKVIEYALSFS